MLALIFRCHLCLLAQRCCRLLVTYRRLLLSTGYKCRAEDVIYVSSAAVAERSGCCDTNASNTGRYVCAKCDPLSLCCSQYEYCVSCCMSPGTTVVAGGTLRGMTKHAVLDPHHTFAVCSAACRTNSRSVEHENAYKHARHHCFGRKPAPSELQSQNRDVGSVFDFVMPLSSHKPARFSGKKSG